jgi:hypothetical protein
MPKEKDTTGRDFLKTTVGLAALGGTNLLASAGKGLDCRMGTEGIGHRSWYLKKSKEEIS